MCSLLIWASVRLPIFRNGTSDPAFNRYYLHDYLANTVQQLVGGLLAQHQLTHTNKSPTLPSGNSSAALAKFIAENLVILIIQQPCRRQLFG